MNWVAVLMGSRSDWPVMKAAVDVLTALGVETEVRVTSAHRTPDATTSYVADAEARGVAVFICGAGMAAHLAGVVAAHSVRPVIGVPVASGPLAGVDALLATVQMPGGIPVATVAVDKAGAKNAGYLAAQIIALSDPALDRRLREERAAQREKIASDNAGLQQELSG